MKRECVELFKEYRVEGEISIYDENGCYIQVIHSATIEEIADEIVEILNHIDKCEYEGESFSTTFISPDKNDIIEVLILGEVDNLMAGTECYNEDDSRTHLWDEITECTAFMIQHPYVEKMVITHKETFLCDDEFTIEISDVFSEMNFSLKVMNTLYDIGDADDDKEWQEFWHDIYKVVTA